MTTKNIRTTSSDKKLLELRLHGILPRIDIAGHDYIVDWQHKELRPLDDRFARIDLRNMPLSADGEKYLCFFHLPTRSVLHLPENITILPEDTVLLEIPNELHLDPVGVARQYGQKDDFLLGHYPVRYELKARVIALEDTGLTELTRQNKKKESKGHGDK